MTDQQQTFQSNVMRFNSRCPIIASPPVEAERVRGACNVFLRTRTYGSRIGAARPLWVNTSRAYCLAGHIRFELRNVGAKYPFERSRRFPGIRPNSRHGDYSRVSCEVGDTQLGSRALVTRRIAEMAGIAEIFCPIQR
jgi:hypothetical protein